jgi:hypothetical protein
MRGIAHALIVAIAALVGGASAVHADTSCTGPLSGTVNGHGYPSILQTLKGGT